MSPVSPSSLAPRRGLALLAGAVLSVAASGPVASAATPPAAAPPAATSSAPVTTPPATSVAATDGLLAWIAANRDHVGLSVVPDGAAPTVAVNAGRRFPLASVRKIAIAGALVASGADLRTTVPRAEVERYYVPDADANHPDAELDPVAPTLQQLLDAMLSLSDNAAADTLLARVGTRAVDRWARAHGLLHQDPAMPLLGELAAWRLDPFWAVRSPAGRARAATALARRVNGTQVRAWLPSIEAQRRLADVSEAGTPAEFARLLSAIARDGDPALVAALDWPRRRFAENAATYDRYLAKGGSFAGVITEADDVEPKGRPGTAVALFFRDLPEDVEQALSTTVSQQALIRRIATDPAFAARVATT